MSSTSTPLGFNLATLRGALPFITGGLHTMGAFSGLYFLLSPADGAQLFGIPFRNPISPSGSELAMTRLHGVRDLAVGVVGLRLVNYVYALETADDMSGAKAVGKVVASLLFAGAAFAVSDAWICAEFASGLKEVEEKGDAREKERREVAKNVTLSHIAVSLPIALLGWAWLSV